MATITEQPRYATPYYLSLQDDLLLPSSVPAKSNDKLPEGFPRIIKSSLVWTGNEMKEERGEWCLVLSKDDVASIEYALKHFESLHISPSELNPRTFPLSDTLADQLAAVSAECYSGRGFVVIQGLDPDKYSEEQNAILFAGISVYVAPQRGFQDLDRSHVLAHIFSRTHLRDINTVKTTPAFVDGAMGFHTDSGDILALYSMKVDERGHTLLASWWQIYNELAVSRPDILETLSKDWVMDTFKDYSQFPLEVMPLLYFFDQKIILHVSRYGITGIGALQRNKDLPPVTEIQFEALNTIHQLGLKNGIALPNKPGDVVFINNMAMIHGREALKSPDSSASSRSLSNRHKMKLWLRDPKRAWKMPPQLQKLWDGIYGPNQDGGGRVEAWMLKHKGPENPAWSKNG